MNGKSEDKEEFESGMKDFSEQAKKAASFNASKNVRIVYELFYENNTAYFSTEDIGEMDLGEFVRRSGGYISEYEALTVAKHICNALMVVHSTGMICRDICPQNIAVTDHGEVKLTDLSKASLTNEADPNFTFKESYGPNGEVLDPPLPAGLGNPYVPGELYLINQKTGFFSDIYSVGALMYFCAFGSNVPSWEDRYLGSEVLFDTAVNDVSEEFKRIVNKCLRKNYTERYQTAIELANDITPLLEKHIKSGNIPTFDDTDDKKIILETAVALSVAGSAIGAASVAGEVENKPKQLTSRDYSNRSTARDAEREKAKNKPENTPPKKASENMIVPAAQDDVVINVGDSAVESAPEIAVGDARQVVPPVKKKKSPVGIIVAIVLILAVISAGAVLYFTGMLDNVLGTGNPGWKNSTGGVCVHCGSGEHLTIDHPPCKFCKVKTHFSEEHPKCKYCGMQEHYTEEHPPCGICGRMDHFTEKHPPCKHCGSTKHFTEGHEPCGICGLNSHFTNKHPCDYCTTGGHDSADCPYKPNPCAICYSNDHITEDHPYYCTNCGYTDHDTNDCPYYSVNPYCNYCNNYGHTAERCPYTSGIYTGYICSYCSGNHSIQQCPYLSDRQIYY